MFYQHPTPIPKSPLTPQRGLWFLLCRWMFWFWCPFHSAIINPAALPLFTVASYARPLPGGKAMGLTILFSMEKSALPKKRTVGSKPPTAFFVQPMLPWGNAPLRLRKVEEDMGTARPHTLRPPLRTVGGFALRGVGLSSRWGRVVAVKKMGKIAKTLDNVCTLWYNIYVKRNRKVRKEKWQC